MKTLVIVNAGLGDPSTTRQVAERIADATLHQVTAAGEGLDVRVVDVRALAADLATYMTTFIATPELEDARRAVTNADALIAATPVFQGSYSGLFKMFFDALDMKSLAGVPVTMVATAGTARHSMVLDFAVRPLLSFLHAVVLPTGVFVDTAEFGAESALSRRVATAAGELVAQLTAVSGVAGFTGSADSTQVTGFPESMDGDATDGAGPGIHAGSHAAEGARAGSRAGAGDSSQGDADFRVPAGGFAALLAGHSGQ